MEQGAIRMHAIRSHPSTRTTAYQVDNLPPGKVIELPSRFAEPEAIVHVLKVHEEAFIQKTNLLHCLPAQHEAGTGNVFYFQRMAIGFIRREIRAHCPS